MGFLFEVGLVQRLLFGAAVAKAGRLDEKNRSASDENGGTSMLEIGKSRVN